MWHASQLRPDTARKRPFSRETCFANGEDWEWIPNAVKRFVGTLAFVEAFRPFVVRCAWTVCGRRWRLTNGNKSAWLEGKCCRWASVLLCFVRLHEDSFMCIHVSSSVFMCLVYVFECVEDFLLKRATWFVSLRLFLDLEVSGSVTFDVLPIDECVLLFDERLARRCPVCVLAVDAVVALMLRTAYPVRCQRKYVYADLAREWGRCVVCGSFEHGYIIKRTFFSSIAQSALIESWSCGYACRDVAGRVKLQTGTLKFMRMRLKMLNANVN